MGNKITLMVLRNSLPFSTAVEIRRQGFPLAYARISQEKD
jgi:hypothetical protein